MKKNIAFIMMVLYSSILYGQIGVYTENPLALFHIDGLANNKPGNINSKDDVAIDISKDSTLIISIGGILDKEGSVQLDLAGEKSGLKLNNVALNSNTDISSLIAPPQNGTIVYNTVSNSTISKGMFFYKDGVWYPLNSRNIVSQIKYLNLSSNVQAYTGTQSFNNPAYSNYLYWDDPTLTNDTPDYLIGLPETASYAFTVRLWGQRPSTTSDARLVIYIWLLKEGIKETSSVLDVAELNIPVPSGVRDYSYSVTLSATVNAGDRVSLSVGAPNNSGSTASMNPGQMIADPASDQNPSRTSVIYWKLQ